MPISSRLPLAMLHPDRASIRKRLWLAGGGVALFVGTIAICNWFIAPDRAMNAGLLGYDFLAFYTAGSFVREGHAAQLYDLDAVRAFQHALAKSSGLHLGNAIGPFWNPPAYAWVFAPLSALPFGAALATWLTIGLAALAGALLLLRRMLPTRDWRSWALVPLWVLFSTPFLLTFTHGQNTFTSLLLVTLVVATWRAGRPFMAGAALGLLLYKPQLAGLIALVLIVHRGWRAAAGLALTSSVLLAITLITLPGTLADYLDRLPANLRFMQVQSPYIWERHVTFKAFWRLLIQGSASGETRPIVTALSALCAFLLGAALLAAAVRARRMTDGVTCDRLIAATIAATPLLMPFYFDYDLLLLAVPIVLFAAELIANRPADLRVPDRWKIAGWISLFLWLTVNPDIAEMTRVNGAVILLSIVSVQCVRAVFSPPSTAQPDIASDSLPIRQAA